MALLDYSDIEKEIDDAPELEALPRGSEIKARIIGIREGTSDKNGVNWFMPTFDDPGNPLTAEFNDFFWDLSDLGKLTEKEQVRALRKFKLFAAAFDLDFSKPFDLDDLISLEGWVILGVKKSDEYGDQNTVSKYVTGK